MAHTNHTQRLAQTEEALTVLFCLIDDAYALLKTMIEDQLMVQKANDLSLTADTEVIKYLDRIRRERRCQGPFRRREASKPGR